MKTPAEYFNEPVIGKIVTTSYKWGDVEFPSTEYDIIAINGDTYICNQWYKEYKHIPQLVHKKMVKTFTKLNEQKMKIKELKQLIKEEIRLLKEGNYKVFVLSIGVVNILSGKTKYSWTIYDEWNEGMQVCLIERGSSEGFLLFSAGDDFKVGDTVKLIGNDSNRSLGLPYQGNVVDECPVNKEKLLMMLKKNGYDYYPLKPFQARPKNNKQLRTSFSVKGFDNV